MVLINQIRFSNTSWEYIFPAWSFPNSSSQHDIALDWLPKMCKLRVYFSLFIWKKRPKKISREVTHTKVFNLERRGCVGLNDEWTVITIRKKAITLHWIYSQRKYFFSLLLLEKAYKKRKPIKLRTLVNLLFSKLGQDRIKEKKKCIVKFNRKRKTTIFY